MQWNSKSSPTGAKKTDKGGRSHKKESFRPRVCPRRKGEKGKKSPSKAQSPRTLIVGTLTKERHGLAQESREGHNSAARQSDG